MIRENSRICMRKDVGLNGNLFGGKMLAWLDESAFIFADRITHNKYFLVTKKFGEIVFRKAVREGDVVDFHFGNVVVGNTSISFDVKVTSGNDIVFNTTAVFVATDKDGRKMKINKDWVDKK